MNGGGGGGGEMCPGPERTQFHVPTRDRSPSNTAGIRAVPPALRPRKRPPTRPEIFAAAAFYLRGPPL